MGVEVAGPGEYVSSYDTINVTETSHHAAYL